MIPINIINHHLSSLSCLLYVFLSFSVYVITPHTNDISNAGLCFGNT